MVRVEHRKGRALDVLTLRNPVSVAVSLGPPAGAQPELGVDPGKGLAGLAYMPRIAISWRLCLKSDCLVQGNVGYRVHLGRPRVPLMSMKRLFKSRDISNKHGKVKHALCTVTG